MGKKSLTQSTTQKKSDTTAKKGTKKKTTAASAKNKTAKNETTKKTAKRPAEKKAAKRTSTQKTAKSASAKKTAAKTPKNPSLKTLRKKKFDTWTPASPYIPKPAPEKEKAFAAPAVTDDYSPEQAEKVRGLLLKKINLSTPEPAPAADGKASAPAETPEPAPQAPKAPKAEDPAASGEKPEEPTDQTRAPAGAEASGKEAPREQGKKVSDHGRPPEPPGPTEPPGGGGSGGDKSPLPISRGLLGLIVVIGLLLALLIGASLQNIGNYYLKQTHSALEIWQGDFSPRGKNRVAVLRGAKAPAEIRDSYSKEKALSYAYDYYMTKADALSETSDLPDFGAIRTYLEEARQFAVTEAQKSRVKQRLHHIEYLMLLFKAEVAAEKQTTESLQAALEYLEQASALQITEAEQEVVSQRMEYTRAALEKLQEQQKQAAEQPESEDAGTDDKAGSGSEEDPGKADQRPETAEGEPKTM